MGNIIGYVKYSCKKCKKYGIQTITSLYPFGLVKEEKCPFCQSEIEKSNPKQLELDTLFKKSKKEIKPKIVQDAHPAQAVNPIPGAGIAQGVLSLRKILIYEITD